MQILVDLVMNERSVRRPQPLDPGHDLLLDATLDNSNALPAPVARAMRMPLSLTSRRPAGRNDSETHLRRPTRPW
jgi:hypothetical protein